MDYEKGQNLTSGENVWSDLTPERDRRALGNKIISTPGETSENPAETFEQVEPTEPNLGIPETLTPETRPEPKKDFDYHAVREEKGSDRISTHTLSEISKLEQKLSQDGNLSDFYDNAREMTGAYLDNSFNRKLGGEKG